MPQARTPSEQTRRPIPPTAQEERRVEAVRRYDILDTPPDGAFDRVAKMAARLLDTPIASVTIVDTDRIWFKAAHGLEGVDEIGRDPGLCSSAICSDEALVIPDALADPVACANPLVAGEMGVRFYAAAPIITPDGHRLGTVNVIDTRPRTITEADTALLADLATMVMDQLKLRLSALAAVRTEQQLRAAERERAEAEHRARERAERDAAAITEFASTLQRTLLPPELPSVPGLELACHYHTASPRQVGGDFYDVFALESGRWAFFLGDVCGKGAEAASLTSLTRHTLRTAAHLGSEPEKVLAALNNALLLDPSVGSRFCTVVFGVAEPAGPDGAFSLTLATGGHPPAYLLSPGEETTRVEAVRPEGGMLIGAVDGAEFSSCSVRLEPGQTLLLYTDGLIEARTHAHAMLGEHGLTAFLSRRSAPLSAMTLVSDTAALLDGLAEEIGDDVALLALGVPGTDTTPTARSADTT